MNLNELREAIASDATKENASLKEENASLKEENDGGSYQMSTIYAGERQSGKTTMLIELSEKTGATIVVATYPMAKYIQMMAA